MRKIRLGHVGSLHDHSVPKLECVLRFSEIFDVVGWVPETAERAEQLRAVAPYCRVPVMSRERLLAAGVDAVLVEGFELELAEEAAFWLSHGVHVHVDKPAGGNIESLERALRLAKRNRLVFQMAYMYRYNPGFLDCRELIRQGKLGEIYEVDAIMNTGHPPEKREWLEQLPGGILFFLGCHMLDLVLQIQGMPDRVTPYLRSTGFDGVKSVDHAAVVLEYPKGISLVRATSTEINGYGRRQLVVCGSEGTYEIKPLESSTRAYFTARADAKTFADCARERILRVLLPHERYDSMMMDFAAFVRGEKENPYTYGYELALQRLLLYCCGQRDLNWKLTGAPDIGFVQPEQ